MTEYKSDKIFGFISKVSNISLSTVQAIDQLLTRRTRMILFLYLKEKNNKSMIATMLNRSNTPKSKIVVLYFVFKIMRKEMSEQGKINLAA